jgi:hypothetical protein
MDFFTDRSDSWLELAMATAMAHAIADVRLNLQMRSGAKFDIAFTDAPHTPCSLRRLLTMPVGAHQFADDVLTMGFTAGLSPLRRNVFRASVDGRCWFATPLTAFDADRILEHLCLAPGTPELSAQVIGDTVLGVTVIGLGVGDEPATSEQVAYVAATAAAACAIEELLLCPPMPSLRHPSRRPAA